MAHYEITYISSDDMEYDLDAILDAINDQAKSGMAMPLDALCAIRAIVMDLYYKAEDD